MKNTTLLFLTLFVSKLGISQSNNQLSYKQLKSYEGHYEYINQSTLNIAASPVDTLLYAIIDKSKYPVYPAGTDLFLTRQKDRVQFFRDKSQAIKGYLFNGDTLHLLNKTAAYSDETWYPRPGPADAFRYVYQQPKSDGDGLLTGNVKHSGLDTALLKEMIEKIVDRTFRDVHSILIVKDRKLVFEEYFYEYNRDTLHELRSTTKSFYSALAGIAIDKGYIQDVDQPVLPFFTEYKLKNPSNLKSVITVRNLLTNQTGLACDITNETPSSNETQMHNSNDWVKYMLDLPMADTPGRKGMYCSGNCIMVGRIIEKKTGKPLVEFADKNLFAPLGITKYKWRFKPDNTSAETFCQLSLRPRDMAKFGLLYLNKGNWNGRQVIPSQWIKESLSRHSVIQGVDYGYQWWIKYLDADGVRYYGKAAQGNGGQKIYLFEDLDMVIVITGGNYNVQSPSDQLIKKYILPSFNKKN